MCAADVAEPPGEHDRLVVAARAVRAVPGKHDLEGAEVAAHRGAAELVVEGRCANRALGHDLERGGDAPRRAEVALPRALEARDAQVRHRESGESRLGFGAAPGRALVANLAA